MLVQVITENGVKKIIPLTADIGAGNPVGTVIVVCSNQIPSNYLPLGTQYDTSLYPVLYALLGTDTTPTANALGLPTLTSGQYAIKATCGLPENQQDNVVAQLNEERSYSTEEVNTGKKWIDGKPIYRRVFTATSAPSDNSLGTIANLDTPIKLEVFARNNADGNWFPRAYGIYQSSGNPQSQIDANGRVFFEVHSYTVNKIIAIVEYTKTTD